MLEKSKILVAMSGGVDSSVAAFLLKERGFAVDGAMMRLFANDDVFFDADESRKCCSLEDAEDARAVCARLGIDFFVFNFADDFKNNVIKRFADGYLRGETPNPCLDCNKYMKSSKFAERALMLGYSHIATGHYAQIECANGRYLLKKGKDNAKDQSYALYAMTQTQLAQTVLPIGAYTKPEIRAIAASAGFDNSAKRDSQDICFVKNNNYGAFLRDFADIKPQKGAFLDINGQEIGTHDGSYNYTIGQRKGTNFSSSTRLYVCGKDAIQNTVTLGEEKNLYKQSFTVRDLNLIAANTLEKPIRAAVKIRYNGREFQARVTQTAQNTASVLFDEPQRAITSGQAAVFYDGDYVIGGGIID